MQRVKLADPVQFAAEAKHTNDHCCESLQQRDEHLVKDQKTKLQEEKQTNRLLLKLSHKLYNILKWRQKSVFDLKLDKLKKHKLSRDDLIIIKEVDDKGILNTF